MNWLKVANWLVLVVLVLVIVFALGWQQGYSYYADTVFWNMLDYVGCS